MVFLVAFTRGDDSCQGVLIPPTNTLPQMKHCMTESHFHCHPIQKKFIYGKYMTGAAASVYVLYCGNKGPSWGQNKACLKEI